MGLIITILVIIAYVIGYKTAADAYRQKARLYDLQVLQTMQMQQGQLGKNASMIDLAKYLEEISKPSPKLRGDKNNG